MVQCKGILLFTESLDLMEAKEHPGNDRDRKLLFGIDVGDIAGKLLAQACKLLRECFAVGKRWRKDGEVVQDLHGTT